MQDSPEITEDNHQIAERRDTNVSPRWRGSTKRIVVTILVMLGLLSLYAIRSVLIPVIMSVVMAYILLPAVNILNKKTRLGRGASVVLIYLGILVILIAIPIGTIPQLVNQGNNLINNTPSYVEDLGAILGEPLTIGSITVPLDQLPLDDVYVVISDNLLTIIQTIAPQSLKLFGATLTTVGWILVVIVLSYYMVKDHQVLWSSIVALAPDVYHTDLKQFGMEANGIWNAFLRGQLVLGLIIGLTTFILALILGLPNALLLGLLAGVLEFIPNIGPVIAAIPAVLLAVFQYETSWLGSMVGPFWFAIIVLVAYGLIQRIENVYLVPRIIGRSLNLHPLVVFIGAIIGASVAGVFGILLAAPLLATAKLVLIYIYRKLLDQPPFDFSE
jgi:predicted PurR-regulated permease PerM